MVVGDGGFAGAGIDDGHLLAVDGMAADISEDGVFVFGGGAGGDGVVNLGGGLALGELGEQGLHGAVGLGDDDAAGGIFVEAVDDAGALDSVDAGELVSAVMEEGVDEGAVGVAGGGVDDHAVGFVEDDEVFVFVEDVEGEVLGDEGEGDGLGDGDADEVAGVEGLLGLGGAVVDEDVSFFDEGLEARAGVFLELGGEVGVEAGVWAVDFESHGLDVMRGVSSSSRWDRRWERWRRAGSLRWGGSALGAGSRLWVGRVPERCNWKR